MRGTFVVISRVIRMRLNAADYPERACCEMFRGILFGAGCRKAFEIADYSERVIAGCLELWTIGLSLFEKERR